MPTEALSASGYFPTLVQPYVESNLLVPVGSLGGQVQVSQPPVSLAQQPPTTSSQQAALEVNGITCMFIYKTFIVGLKMTQEKQVPLVLGAFVDYFKTNF